MWLVKNPEGWKTLKMDREMAEEVKRRVKIYAALLVLSVSGCASTKTVHIPLESKPNYMQVTEVRTSWFSTHTVAVVYDENGNLAGVTGSGGRAIIDLPLSVLGAGATVTGAVILGRGLKGAAKGMTLDADVTHSIDAEKISIPEVDINELRERLE